jgi:hypothetical protein
MAGNFVFATLSLESGITDALEMMISANADAVVVAITATAFP